MKRNILSSVLCASIMLLGLSAQSQDQFEPDDASSQANPIYVSDPASAHTFHDYGDIDWSVVQLLPGHRYTIEATQNQVDLVMDIYTWSGSELTAVTSVDDTAAGSLPEQYTTQSLTLPTYFFISTYAWDPNDYGPAFSYTVRVKLNEGDNLGLVYFDGAIGARSMDVRFDPFVIPNIQGFNIRRSTDYFFSTWTLANSSLLSPTTLTFHDTGLDPQTPYYYQVYGWDGSQDLIATELKGATTLAEVIGVPDPPTNPGATGITQTAITWTWEDNASNETGYEIFAGPGATAPLTSLTLTAENAESWDYNGSTANTQYAFQTRARNAAGVSGKTPNINRYTLAATPLAPLVTNPQVNTLDVTIAGGDGNPAGTEYAIQVQPEVGGAGSGRIWVQGDGSVGSAPIYLPASSWGAKNVNGLAESTGYTFRAQARNGDGLTTALGAGTAGTTLTPAPGDPTNPGATGITQTAITWTWQDNASNEIGYEIFAGPGATAPPTSLTLTAEDVQSWEHTGLTANTQYAFQTRARNAGGVSAKTSNISRYTLAATPVAPLVANPHLNTLDVAIAAGDGNPLGTEYAIQVQPEVGGAGHIWVQSNGSVGATPAWRTAAQWGASGAGTTVAGLEPSTVYSFTARARNGDGVETSAGPAGQGSTAHELPAGAAAAWVLYE